jgi:hypothetical protein
MGEDTNKIKIRKNKLNNTQLVSIVIAPTGSFLTQSLPPFPFVTVFSCADYFLTLHMEAAPLPSQCWQISTTLHGVTLYRRVHFIVTVMRTPNVTKLQEFIILDHRSEKFRV